jgi:UDP-glucose:(heptosyl)LPS alpha-1,3-glucosyltransferase
VKIAAFIPSVAAGTGGTERCAAALLKELSLRGHEVSLFTSDASGQDLAAVEVIKVARISSPSPAAYTSFLTAAAIKRRAHGPFDIIYSPGANTLAADVVTAHYSAARGRKLMKSGELALSGSRLRKLARRSFLALAESMERRLYRSDQCRRIIAVSERLKGDLVEDYDLDFDKLMVIPDGIDLEEFNAAEASGRARTRREQLGIAAGEQLALFLGGDWERKGLGTLLEAFSRLSPERSGLKLAVVGQGDVQAWKTRAESLGLGERVFFPGATGKPAEWYAAADFLVLPSRYEPFGLPPLEAAACGTAALFSGLCGSAEVLPHEDAALHLADPKDPEELKMKMERLAADEELRGRLAGRAGKIARELGWARIAAETEAVFEQVLEEKRKAEGA